MLERVPHRDYSLDLSPCDFWLFGMLKQKITDRVFRTIEEILAAIWQMWSEVPLKQLQSVSSDGSERVEYIIIDEGEDYAKWH
jgi:hypothetical protein